ncbi:hypothetical protein ANO11243_062510 [Dothideomycetidae sp. 11243]|nr:hypothetical protein ANO11243_062510 [fungal sp. No.11243]
MASAIKDKISSMRSSSPPESERNQNYRLRITAGPTYDKSLQRLIKPNSDEAHVVSENVSLSIRIKDYSGFPSTSPSTSEAYFSQPAHSKDTFSIAFAFTPPHDVSVADLMFGVDTGHNPIRKFGIPKSLVNTAFRIVKDFIDPSLACDAGADEPWLRGPVVAGASTTMCVGDRPSGGEEEHVAPVERKDSLADPDTSSDESKSRRSSYLGSWSRTPSPPDVDLSGEVFPSPALLTEGATSASAKRYRRETLNIPSDAKGRRKFYNNSANRTDAKLQAGRTYYFDFANAYIDWSAYAIKLPGFSVPVLKWLGSGKPPPSPEEMAQQGEVKPGQGGKKSPSHKVRFFLKDVNTGEVYFVIMATLVTGEELGAALMEDKEIVAREKQGQQQAQMGQQQGQPQQQQHQQVQGQQVPQQQEVPQQQQQVPQQQQQVLQQQSQIPQQQSQIPQQQSQIPEQQQQVPEQQRQIPQQQQQVPQERQQVSPQEQVPQQAQEQMLQHQPQQPQVQQPQQQVPTQPGQQQQVPQQVQQQQQQVPQQQLPQRQQPQQQVQQQQLPLRQNQQQQKTPQQHVQQQQQQQQQSEQIQQQPQQ